MPEAPTPSAPTAEMLAQARARLQSSVSWMLHGKHTGPCISVPDMQTMLLVLDAALARSEPPTEGKMDQAVATPRQPIVPEGWPSIYAFKPFAIHAVRVAFIGAGTKPENAQWVAEQIIDGAENMMKLQRMNDATPVASDRDSLLPASQPTEPPTGEPVAKAARHLIDVIDGRRDPDASDAVNELRAALAAAPPIEAQAGEPKPLAGGDK